MIYFIWRYQFNLRTFILLPFTDHFQFFKKQKSTPTWPLSQKLHHWGHANVLLFLKAFWALIWIREGKNLMIIGTFIRCGLQWVKINSESKFLFLCPCSFTQYFWKFKKKNTICKVGYLSNRNFVPNPWIIPWLSTFSNMNSEELW